MQNEGLTPTYLKGGNMKKIGIIVGSLRQNSLNKQLAEKFVKIGHPELEFSFIDIKELPLFSEDLEENPPSAVVQMRKDIQKVDTVLFMVPEYNRSVSGVLKNAIDWASRPYNQGCLKGKNAAMAGVAYGMAGTAVAQSHLRSILPVVGMNLIQQPEMYITYKEGIWEDEKTSAFFKSFLKALAQ